MGSWAVFRVTKKVGQQFIRDDVSGMSAELAYRMLFAIFPFFIFLTALSSFVAAALNIENPASRIVDQLGDALPEDAGSVLETQLENVMETQPGALLSFGALAALWAASSATNAAVKVMNRAYDVPESRPIYKKYPRVIGLTLLFAFSILAAFFVVFAVQIFGREIADFAGIGEEFAFVVYVLQFPLALLFIVVGVSFFYWAGPNLDVKFRWLTPGALLFVVVWLLATFGFAFYVSNFADYNATYGALGGVIILMLWFYLTGMALLLGAEFNAVLEEETDPEGMEERRQRIRGEAGAARPREALPGRSPVSVAKERPVAAGFGAVVAGLLLFRLLGQRDS